MDGFSLTFWFESHDVPHNRLSHESRFFVDIDNLFEKYRHYNGDQGGNGKLFTCGEFSFARDMVCEFILSFWFP